MLLPTRLFQGTSSPSNFLTPRMRESGFAISAPIIEAMHAGVCCPSESAVTHPITLGILSLIYSNAVFSALPLPLLGRYEMYFPPWGSMIAAAWVKISSYSGPLPSLTIMTGAMSSFTTSFSSVISRSSGSYEGMTIGTFLVKSSI